MKQSGNSDIKNDGESTSSAPPDWFLKRRVRQNAGSVLNAGSPAPSRPLEVTQSLPSEKGAETLKPNSLGLPTTVVSPLSTSAGARNRGEVEGRNPGISTVDLAAENSIDDDESLSDTGSSIDLMDVARMHGDQTVISSDTSLDYDAAEYDAADLETPVLDAAALAKSGTPGSSTGKAKVETKVSGEVGQQQQPRIISRFAPKNLAGSSHTPPPLPTQSVIPAFVSDRTASGVKSGTSREQPTGNLSESDSRAPSLPVAGTRANLLKSGFDPVAVDLESFPSIQAQVNEPFVVPSAVSPAAKSGKSRLISKEEEEPEELTPFQLFTRRWLGTEVIGSYTISVLLHVVAAFLLSLMVFHREIQQVAFTTIIGSGDAAGGGGDGGDGTELDDTTIPVDAAGIQAATDLDTDIFNAKSVAGLNPLLPSSIEAVVGSSGSGGGSGGGDGTGQGSGIGDGLNIGGFQMPEGGKAVSKGSFTVWTVPSDPAPNEDYLIIIQVKYKKPNQKLTRTDITGNVRGTDRFRLAISEETTTIVPEANQVVVRIPGASARVKDTINVSSTLLRESQKLTITF